MMSSLQGGPDHWAMLVRTDHTVSYQTLATNSVTLARTASGHGPLLPLLSAVIMPFCPCPFVSPALDVGLATAKSCAHALGAGNSGKVSIQPYSFCV